MVARTHIKGFREEYATWVADKLDKNATCDARPVMLPLLLASDIPHVNYF